MNKIFLFGECMVELASNTDNTLNQAFAGDTFNTAVYLKRAFDQTQVHLLSAVGQDKLSKSMLNLFEKEQLNTDLVFQDPVKLPGIYWIQTDEFGERSFNYWRNDSAVRQLMKWINYTVTQQLSVADWFFFSGISLAVLNPQDRNVFWQLLGDLKKAGVKIAFDPNYRAQLWVDETEAKTHFEKAFALSDMLLPGVDDFKTLYNMDTAAQVHSFCERFNIAEMVIKNGEKGVYCVVDNQVQEYPIDVVEKVVDTTSAGDSFNGVYLGARMAGLEIEQAVSLAAKSAALVIQHKGAIIPEDIFKNFWQRLV